MFTYNADLWLTSYYFNAEYGLEASQCILWRVSFSYAEKTILLKADSHRKIDVRRKDLIRLLKCDLEGFRRKPKAADLSPVDISTDDLLPDVSSYVMKTLALHMFDIYPAMDWTPENINKRHIYALRYLKGCLLGSSLESGLPMLKHYFQPKYNVFSNLLQSPTGNNQRKHLLMKLERLIDILQNNTNV